ncbi:Major facilitator superfamily transporter [Tolypocladium capitatum]|uniref:Major facilitator superfamily transporter n=1 Tax=Tolypocladium capitatum TaxID=45235 RepID=A0A2K3QGK5_9HYPO|nr:Major facilitator superfamily transporter [Tolypocladium capitatum]
MLSAVAESDRRQPPSADEATTQNAEDDIHLGQVEKPDASELTGETSTGRITDGTTEPSATTDDEGTEPKKSMGFYLSFTGIQIMVFIYSLDATTLAVAIPTIAAQLGGTTLESFWASISYLLLAVVTQPLYSAVSDAFGRLAPLYFALLIFAAGSIVFATAQSMILVIVGRVLQGIGGGGIDVLGEIIVTDMTTLRERPFYLGIMALPVAAGSVLGPTFGALFSDFVTWRWIGWINLPILGAAFPLVFFFLRLRSPVTTISNGLKGLDWLGMALFTSGCTAFVVPLSWAGALFSWSSWRTLLPLILGIAVLAIFTVYESKPTAPLMPHRLFRSRTASLTLFGSFIHGMLLFPLLQYLPLFYQAIILDTRIQVALTMLPTNVICVLAAFVSAIAVGILGRGYRWGIWLSWIFTTLGAGLLILMDPSTSSNMQRGIPILCGAGVGGLLRLNQLPIQASLKSVDDTGMAVTLLITFRLLGGLTGLAIGSTMFSNAFAPYVHLIKGYPDSMALPNDASQAIGFIPHLRTINLPPETMEITQQAYLASLRQLFYAMTGFSFLGFLSSLFIEELSIQSTDLGQQRFED